MIMEISKLLKKGYREELINSQQTLIDEHDKLTGLPNNNYFISKLKHQCHESDISHSKFALIMLDIDGLKKINYSLGYEYGNDVIIQIIKRLRELFFEDTFISRCSDECFAIILQELFHEEYMDKTKDIINLLTKSYIVDKYELNINVNIGVCFYPDCSKEPDMLSQLAKVTLHRAIKEGKNKFKFYSTGLNIQNYKELMIRNDFQHAIEKKEFKAYYQPILNLKTNEIIAAEALVRWEHPDWGILSPNEFIPLAEETGLIIDIGKLILREVCSDYKRWLNNGYPNIEISVNFSSVQFFENNFVDNIINIINEFDLNPKFLSMEITESILMKDTDKVNSDLKRLKSFGIQIALDDFGTGFSSLSYLNSLIIDILKIDGSFIKNIITDETSSIITKTIINLVNELNIRFIAEGIETREQLELLREMNCFAGQGYLYSRPVLSEEFEELLINGIHKPETINNTKIMPKENRRKYFRIQFHQLLEADMTILNINGKSVNLGSTKVLIKDIGPGGLCFVSNLRLPYEKNVTLMFSTVLMEQEIKVYGHPVRIKESNNINEYGVEFTIYGNGRNNLIRVLDNVKFNMRTNILFADGKFTTKTEEDYFN